MFLGHLISYSVNYLFVFLAHFLFGLLIILIMHWLCDLPFTSFSEIYQGA